jgi:hypothetical protein
VGVLWVALIIYALPALVVVGLMHVLHMMPSVPEPEPLPSTGPFNIWEQVVARVEAKVGRMENMWFSNTMLVSDEGGVLRVRIQPREAASIIVARHVAP